MTAVDGLSRTLAECVAGAEAGEGAARQAARHSLLDTVGVIIAGSRQPDVLAIVDLARQWQGAPHSAVIGHDMRMPAPHAALLNGAMVHQWDYDDTHDVAALHPSAGTVPGALAVAQSLGGVSGRGLLDAIVVGNDLVCRLGSSITGRFIDYPWMRPQILSAFGAAAAAGRVMGLDAETIEHAFGIALPQASGTSASAMSSGSSVRGIRDGFAAYSGVLAAQFAAAGIKGDPEPFEGDYGLYQSFFRGEVDYAAMLDGLGTRFTGDEISFKRWPCCRPTHNALTAFLQLIADQDLVLDEIAHVQMNIGQWTYRRCKGPRSEYAFPASKIDAHCDLPFVMSVAMSTGGVALADFAAMGDGDPRMADALARLDWTHDERMDGTNRTMEPVELVVRTRSGQEHVVTSDYGLGHPSSPLSTQALVDKFMECGRFAGHYQESRLEQIAEACLRVDELADAGELFELL